MTRIWLLLSRYCLRLLPVVLLAGSVSGCDGGASKRDSQYKRLSGRWAVQNLVVDGVARNVEVRVEFSAPSEGRSYRLVHVARNDSATVQGPVEMLSANTLGMMSGFARPLVWSFTFEEPDALNSSVRFRLERTWQGSSQAFLKAVGLSGGARRIEMDLVRE